MKLWKRALSVVLAATMVVSMSACGAKKPGSNTNGKPGKNDFVAASSEEAKNYVYKLQEFDLSKLQGKDQSLSVAAMDIKGDQIVMLLQVYDYSENSNGQNSYKLVNMNKDGSNLTVNDIVFDAVQPEETAAKKELSEDAYEYEWYNNYQFVDDKCFYAIRSYEYTNYADESGNTYVREQSVCCFDMKGELLWKAPLEVLSDESSWHYVGALIANGTDSVTLLIGGDDSGIITVTKDGDVSDLKASEELASIMQNYSSSATMADGKMLFSYYSDDWTKMSIATYDTKAGKILGTQELPSSTAYNISGSFCADKDGNIVFANASGVYKYTMGAEKEEMLMSYVNSDLYMDGMGNVLPIDENSFVGFYPVYDENYEATLSGGLFTKVDPKDIPDKKVLVLGGSYLFGDIMKRVVNFNKTNDSYRIVVRDYSQFNSYDDYTASYTQLNNDIISGKMPDILVVESYNMSLGDYASKGLLADIGTLISEDEELSKVEFAQNVFDACKINGKLYEVVPNFYVNTYIAKKELVGDRKGWTMDEAVQIAQSLPEAQLFSNMTRDQFMNAVMENAGAQFVDVSTGKCSFDSEGFIALMNYAKTLPEEYGEEYYDEGWYQTYESQYRDNRTIAMYCSISNVRDLVYSINGYMGGDVSYVGFPNANKEGSTIYTGTSYALAAGSPNLDAAWDFVKYYLQDEYQKNMQWQLPVTVKYIKDNAQLATKKPTYEYDGEETEEDYTWWINEEMITLDPLSQEQVDQVLEVLLNTNRRAYQNTEITNIVNEEMGSLYSGQKSAKDVASVIQSRAQIYVNENR